MDASYSLGHEPQDLSLCGCAYGRYAGSREANTLCRWSFSFGGNWSISNYDWPDGKKVVMILTGKPGPNPRRFNVVLNWFEELIAREHGGQ